MNIKDITPEEKNIFNAVVHHPLQSYEWGEFRKKLHTKVIRKGIFTNGKIISGFQLTIHRIPYTPFTIGYLPKGCLPDENLLSELTQIGRKENCIFIQLEPNVEKEDINLSTFLKELKYPLYFSFHPLFTKYTFTLDLSATEEEILKNMHSKTRYNIRVAQKHGVIVKENNSSKAFEAYLNLTEETTTRQKFYAHSQQYHKIQWSSLPHTIEKNNLSSHLLTATYKEKILTSWIVFIFDNKLYYPYGASSSEYREAMSSTLMMWEAIRFGKKNGCTNFDMWGALGPNPQTTHAYYGFHRFKQGFGARHTEFIGSFDLVINPLLYRIYKIADKTRWVLLKLRK